MENKNIIHKAGYTICHDTINDTIYNILIYAYNKKIYKKDLTRISSDLFLIKDEEKEIYNLLIKYGY